MPYRHFHKQEAYWIGEEYGFFPNNRMKFELQYNPDGTATGFFANKSNRSNIHIKWSQNDLPNYNPDDI